MNLIVEPSRLRGTVEIPGSKSHTIRAVAIAALANGESIIEEPLISEDALAAFRAYRAFGASITDEGRIWRVTGVNGAPQTPDNIIDTANSGTTMRIGLGSAGLLQKGLAVFTGDDQVRRRPCGPLVQALNDLGARAQSTRGTGTPPIIVEGRMKGGETTIEAVTSQYVSSLLINTPLGDGDTLLRVPLLNEKPYVEMTLDWLMRQGIRVEYAEDLSEFRIPGGQSYPPVRRKIPGDFSSATFFLAAGALGDNDVTSNGLDLTDTQGDKAVVEYLRQMGAAVTVEGGGIRVNATSLTGCEIDMNATPDALPMMAVAGCFAKGTTRLVHVPQARLKETDRIAVMRMELEKLGARISELPDGLVIEESALHRGMVEGHGDHRIVMSLAIAGTRIPGGVTIQGYEAVSVTFPTFLDALHRLGGNARIQE